jgi:hypothetical protein
MDDGKVGNKFLNYIILIPPQYFGYLKMNFTFAACKGNSLKFEL